MDRERDLDELLKSIKERRGEIEKDIEPVLPPKEYQKNDDLLWIDSNDIKNKITAKANEEKPIDILEPPIDTLEPPKIYNKEPLKAATVDDKSDKASKPKKEKIKKQKAKKEKVKEEKVKKKEPKREQSDKEKPALTFSKIMAIVIAVMVIIGVVAGSVAYCYVNKLYCFENTDNGFSYETDIISSYKEQYAANNTFAGKIIIEDIDANDPIYTDKNSESAYFYKGSDITKNQQIMSIDMTHYGQSLEKLYSTESEYVKASQKITLSTLFVQKNYKVIGAYYTNKNADDNLGYVFPYTLNGTLTKQSFADYRDAIKIRFLYNTGYDISYDSEILNLCSDSSTLMPNYKFVVVCVRMDDIDKTTITASNPTSVYYPQSYFDKNNLANPYEFAKGLNWKPTLTFDEKEENTKTLKQQEYIEN